MQLFMEGTWSVSVDLSAGYKCTKFTPVHFLVCVEMSPKNCTSDYNKSLKQGLGNLKWKKSIFVTTKCPESYCLKPLRASTPSFAEFLGDCVTVVTHMLMLSLPMAYPGPGRPNGFAAVSRVYFGTAWQILAGITWHSLPLEFVGKVYFNFQS